MTLLLPLNWWPNFKLNSLEKQPKSFVTIGYSFDSSPSSLLHCGAVGDLPRYTPSEELQGLRLPSEFWLAGVVELLPKQDYTTIPLDEVIVQNECKFLLIYRTGAECLNAQF